MMRLRPSRISADPGVAIPQGQAPDRFIPRGVKKADKGCWTGPFKML